MADDLSAPLGRDRKDKPEKRASIVPTLFAGALGLFLAIFLVWAAVFDDPFGGEPMVVMATDPNPTAAKKPQEAADKAAKTEPAPKPAATPAEAKDDKALTLAFDLLRGSKTNAAFPPSPKGAVPN